MLIETDSISEMLCFKKKLKMMDSVQNNSQDYCYILQKSSDKLNGTFIKCFLVYGGSGGLKWMRKLKAYGVGWGKLH